MEAFKLDGMKLFIEVGFAFVVEVRNETDDLDRP
jgi:hypothetical protein